MTKRQTGVSHGDSIYFYFLTGQPEMGRQVKFFLLRQVQTVYDATCILGTDQEVPALADNVAHAVVVLSVPVADQDNGFPEA